MRLNGLEIAKCCWAFVVPVNECEVDGFVGYNGRERLAEWTECECDAICKSEISEGGFGQLGHLRTTFESP